MQPQLRIGQGIDFHVFTAGDHVVLGGVRIAYTHGLLAHSDGDVVIHALMDALLGALSLGDIGQHFPDSDSAYAGADSLDLLVQVNRLIHRRGFELVNADITIVCEFPKIAPHREAMVAHISNALLVHADQISIKATTSEKMGAMGRGEGIMASAVVLLSKMLQTDAYMVKYDHETDHVEK